MIIDTHVHLGGDSLGFNMSEPVLEGMLSKYNNIDTILVSNADCAEADHQFNIIPMEYQRDQVSSLKRVLDFARRFPGKVYAAVWVKPYGEVITEEFEKLIKDNLDIIKAIKLHPYHSKTSPTDPKCLPYLELANRYGLTVVSHTGTSEYDTPIHLYEAACMFPDINFVMVHMGLGSDNSLALDLLGKADNLYGDTAWVPTSTTIEAIRRYGSKKMLFGSDAPIDGLDTYENNGKGEISLYQEYFNVLPTQISEDEYKDLMYRNAVRIFKLDV